MISQFEMPILRLMSYFLGIEVIQVDNGIFIFQKKYPSNILKKFKMKLGENNLCNFINLIKFFKNG